MSLEGLHGLSWAGPKGGEGSLLPMHEVSFHPKDRRDRNRFQTPTIRSSEMATVRKIKGREGYFLDYHMKDGTRVKSVSLRAAKQRKSEEQKLASA